MYNNKAKPIFRKILLYMVILIIIQTLALSGVLFLGGVVSQLNKNAEDIIQERALNRKNYLETQMVKTWSNLDTAVSNVNRKAQEMLDDGIIENVNMLDDTSENCAGLLLKISDDLISLMRSNRVTGAYVIFNSDDLDEVIESGLYQNKPGIYLRDLDPDSTPSQKNADILIEKAPVSVVHNIYISTSSSWRPMFDIEKDKCFPDYIYEPFQKAYINSYNTDVYTDYGYWGQPNEFDSITYSVPLILDDGTVYGVIGVDISIKHLKKLSPYTELAEDKTASYIIAVEEDDNLVFQNVMINGPIYLQYASSSEEIVMTSERKSDVQNEHSLSRYQDYQIQNTGSEKFYCCVEYFTLYNTNTPFVNQKWALIATIRTYDLYAFSNKILETLIASIVVTFICGIFGSYIAGRTISSPIVRMTKALDTADPNSAVNLKRTGISEIDVLAESIENLSSDVIDSAFKFTQIMDMAVVKIACFEINYLDKTFFITDKFFKIFQDPDTDTSVITADKFLEIIKSYDKYKISPGESNENITDTIYKIPNIDSKESVPEDGYVYVRFKYLDDGKRYIGLVEDITQAMLEKIKLEHERDYDLLTGLLNRRAFLLSMNRLFHEEKESLKCAAMVMMDLDNLKYINDTYGHEYGDIYIRSTAEAFIDGSPKSTVISRISGDEFYLFFYGYSTEEEVRNVIANLRDHIAEKTILLPNQDVCYLRISGGISWYPSDSTDYDELMRYSDFALNSVKKSIKGNVVDFDINAYNYEAYLVQNKAELTELIEKALITYHFQPIVDAETGEIYAYEAFMRANMPTLKNPEEIITLAKLEGKLSQIEFLTWFKVMETYSKYINTGIISPKCKVFINSISGQAPSEANMVFLEERYSKYLKNIVLEIRDDERSNSTTLKFKKEKILEWCAELAIDSYGKSVLQSSPVTTMSPNYIKINVPSGINSNDINIQAIKAVIDYSHEKGIKIIAEKIETEDEAALLKNLGADYLQGYFIAKPSEVPMKKVI